MDCRKQLLIALLTWIGFIGLPRLSLPAEVPPTSAKQADPRIEAARQEKELNWVDSVVVPSSATKIAEAFKRRYGLPNLKVNHRRLDSGKVGALITEEVKANRVTIDIFATASPRLFYSLKEAGALAQYSSPEYKFYRQTNEKNRLTNEPGYWMSPVAYVQAPVANPKFYSKPIRSWYDLLDPELKGHKVEWLNVPTSESSLYHYVGLRKVLPVSYFKKLKEQEPAFGISSVERTRKLTTGEMLVTVTSAFRMYQNWLQTGVALKAYMPKEGVPLFGHPYGILAKAPSPNAARLFVDFIFSEEGQTLYQKLEGTISAREGIVVPNEVSDYSPQIAQINPVPLDWKGLTRDELEAARQEFLQIFETR